jgi:excisionase family DNA binding protein
MELSFLREKGPKPMSEKKSWSSEKTKLLCVAETAEALGVSRQTVNRLIIEGSLPAICLRSGRRKKTWRIRAELLDKWILQKERDTRQQAVRNGREIENDSLAIPGRVPRCIDWQLNENKTRKGGDTNDNF